MTTVENVPQPEQAPASSRRWKLVAIAPTVLVVLIEIDTLGSARGVFDRALIVVAMLAEVVAVSLIVRRRDRELVPHDDAGDAEADEVVAQVRSGDRADYVALCAGIVALVALFGAFVVPFLGG